MSYAINLAAFTAAVTFVQLLFYDTLTPLLALTPALIFSQPWTLVTAMFLHADLIHLAFNLLALVMFGPILESRIGPKQLLLLFLVGGIIGNLGYALTDWGSTIPGLGASGAVFAILGALALLEPKMTVFVGVIPMPMYLAGVVWFLTETVMLNVPGDFIARGAHLGGMIFGLAYAYYLQKNGQAGRAIYG